LRVPLVGWVGRRRGALQVEYEAPARAARHTDLHDLAALLFRVRQISVAVLDLAAADARRAQSAVAGAAVVHDIGAVFDQRVEQRPVGRYGEPFLAGANLPGGGDSAKWRRCAAFSRQFRPAKVSGATDSALAKRPLYLRGFPPRSGLPGT